MKVEILSTQILLLCLLNLLPVVMHGQSDAALVQYLSAASRDNPALLSAISNYQSSMEAARQAGALPDPQLSMGYFLRPMQFPMGNQRAELSVMQMFPWFGMNRTQRNEATAMAQGKHEEFRSQKNQVFYEIKLTWYELSQLEAELMLVKEELEIMETTKRLLTAKLSSGTLDIQAPTLRPRQSLDQSAASATGGSSDMQMGGASGESSNAQAPRNMDGMSKGMGGAGSSMADLLQIEINIENLLARMDDLKDAMEPRMVRLNFLAGYEPGTKVVTNDLSLPNDWESVPVWNEDELRQNPMLQMNAREQEAIVYKQLMTKLNARPMFGLGFNYMVFSPLNEQGMQMGGDNMIMPMATMTLPIFGKKNKAFQKAADLEAEAIQHDLESIEQGLFIQWKDAEREFKDAKRRIALFKKQIELTQRIRTLTINSYSAGQTGYEAVLDTDVQLLALKNQKIAAIADWHKTMAKFEYIRGAATIQ